MDNSDESSYYGIALIRMEGNLDRHQWQARTLDDTAADETVVPIKPFPQVFCQLAPMTCELIKTRPEINECKFMNVNYAASPKLAVMQWQSSSS